MEDEVSIFSTLAKDLTVSISIGMLSTAVFFYCFVSLRKSGKVSQLKRFSYFSAGFLLYFIGNIMNYTVVPVLSLVSADTGLNVVDVVMDAIYYVLNFGATVFFFMGARTASVQVRT
ncbi:hypothetical protein [Microbulbifer aggregans]|uniref:hypothetical protein n=1 Tax=Microbulbifer aggregans TaxID=1769779 RepID=UPI001CFF3D2F|nr:hypothetical protein [Microbulbifer aggregans]